MATNFLSNLNRRDFLKLSGTLAGGYLLAACQENGMLAGLLNDQWAFCLHDYQLTGVWDHDRKYRTHPKKKAKPETVTTFLKDKFVELTPNWQWFW
ncbi:MAG: twin-arginine translocation signal domain-containing protein, partial [Anaerolineae bacterium]|nr:twin-arginine translocation signal domain-containing protein [Anaerolineae bacterium]